MLTEDNSITYDELVAYKHSTRMEAADAILPELLQAAQKSTDPAVGRAAKVLAAWDRHTDATSRGGVLFQVFVDRYFGTSETFESKLRVKYDPAKPLESGYGLNDPAGAVQALGLAAADCISLFGALDVPWGDVFRYERGKLDVAANGGHGRMGVFRTMQFGRRKGNKFYGTHGETFVCAIEFGAPQKANCLLGYGNASQAGSPHIEDQLPLLAAKKLHPVWRERKEIEANLEKKETLRAR
jgi:acyl-homoserine-lactone acylase